MNHPRSTDTVAQGPWWDSAVFAGLVACLVWAPLPLGSNRPWAVALLAMALWALLLCHMLCSVLGGQTRAWSRLARSALPAMLIGGFALLVALQWTPWPRLRGLQTADAFQTHVYLLTALAHLAALVLVLLCINTAQRATWLLGAVVGAGVLQAFVAVALLAGGGTYQFLFADFSQYGRASGTYPNPDHLAGFMELCLSAGLGLMLTQFGGARQAQRGWRQATVDGLAFLMSGKMLLRLMLVVMVVALVMTHSRMGNGAFFVALLLVGALVAFLSTKLRKPALWLVASMALIDVFVIGQWVGLDRVVERMQGSAESTMAESAAASSGVAEAAHRPESIQERLQIPQLSLPLVASKPWFGRGGGNFALALPSIKPQGFPLHWDHAHNDYVEVAVDTGLVGLALLLALCTATAWRAVRMLRDSQPRLKRGVGAAALMALCCMGSHSLVDFNMQIPANALTLVVLMALVWAMPNTQIAPPVGAASTQI